VANLLSMALAATLGDVIGVRTVFVACGLIMTLAAGLGWIMLQEPSATPVPSSVVVASSATD
jgi:hypothetical protein